MSGDGGHERALWIEVRWPDGRFHGVREARTAGREAVVPEWPPSPFRLFQALVAGAYGGRWAGEDGEALAAKDEAFCWLEGLHPPSVSAPAGKPLRPVTYYVPNNDADAVGGDPGRIGEIRSAKELRTSLFDADRPAAYLWRFDAAADDGEGRAQRMAELAGRLHTLGHGIDAAFAHAEVVDAAEGERRQLALGGAPRRPSLRPGGKGEPTPCPAVGSLGSLKARHAAFTGRFARVGSGRRAVTRFSQPPKAHARAVAYERAPTRLLYELRPLEGGKQFRAWPLTEAAGLAVAVRDLAAGLLADAWPGEVERLIFGRGAGPHEKALRLRILPLPSLGSTHTDMGVRRMLVEIPPDHPIPVADIDWALAGREPARADGELTGLVLTPADDQGMLDREYLSTDHKGRPTARVWRTTTPAALPWRGPRGKTPGEARTAAEAQAAAAVVDALRHAGVVTPVTSVRVQREPFQPKGERADAFVLEGDLAARFSKGDLRHVEVTFAEPAAGPLALGNGRWTGLGVMRGEAERKRRRAAGVDGVHVFTVSGADALTAGDAEPLSRALRRAVMARAAVGLRRGDTLPAFFCGHAPGDGRTGPAASGLHEHLFFAFDAGGDTGARPRLLVLAPHLADRRPGVLKAIPAKRLVELDAALAGLDDLRAGALGRLSLQAWAPGLDGELGVDPVLGRARDWVSSTPYLPCRHPARGRDVRDAVVADVTAEALRRGLPRPAVDAVEVEVGPRGGLSARLRLRFATATAGPILLGRGSHLGQGLFRRADPDTRDDGTRRSVEAQT